ncbi:hypothetical protein Tco_0872994 [Tanacetum coccineum]|uniref:Uncharacterized protein n=1 Tax=Tanacetum coccineum TaxID=301880 RepID=A0ABQ5GM98_9ASTR
MIDGSGTEGDKDSELVEEKMGDLHEQYGLTIMDRSIFIESGKSDERKPEGSGNVKMEVKKEKWGEESVEEVMKIEMMIESIVGYEYGEEER